MNILIAYDSKLDQTAQAGKLLAEYLRRTLRTDPVIVDFGRRAALDFEYFDAVILGGHMWYGRLDSGLKQFIERYETELLDQNPYLYVNSYSSDEKFKQQMVGQLPLEFLENSVTTNIGQTVDFDKLNPIQKVKWTLTRQQADTKFNRRRIQELATRIAKPE